MIKNVIFDIGNVLLNFDRDRLVKHFYDGDDLALFKEKIFDGWELMDEDAISVEDYEKKVLSSLPESLKSPAKNLLRGWEDFMIPADGMERFVKELKAHGYKLYVLSNMTRHFIKNERKFPVLKLFDGVVYSAPIGMVKPSPEIYRYILQKYSLVPEECFFIDDKKENLDQASRFGMKTFLYDNDTENLKSYFNSLTL